MWKKNFKKALAILLIVSFVVSVKYTPAVNAGSNVSTTQTEKLYLAYANDPVLLNAISSNFGGVSKASPYNAYADSENGTRGAYVARGPALAAQPFVHVYYENGVDVTTASTTDGNIYFNLYWQGTASANEYIYFQFSDKTTDAFGATDDIWTWPIRTTDLVQGWNLVKAPVGTWEGVPLDRTNVRHIRVLNANASGTTALACGATYTYNVDSTKRYLIHAQDEMTADLVNNCSQVCISDTFTDYDDGDKGAYICANPTTVTTVPFMNLTYATPISLKNTSGVVTTHLYHTANAETENEHVIVRLQYSDGTYADTAFWIYQLDSGWNTVTVTADVTKKISGILVYSTTMAGATALAVGSAYVTYVAEEKVYLSHANDPFVVDTVTDTIYLAHANDPIVQSQMYPNFGGVSKSMEYTAYADSDGGTHGAYLAANPASALSLVHVYYENGIDTTTTSTKDGTVYFNLYWKGTASSSEIIYFQFSDKTTDGFYGTDTTLWTWPVSTASLVQGWNLIGVPIGYWEGVALDRTSVKHIRIINVAAPSTTALACGATYTYNRDNTKNYIINAQDEMVVPDAGYHYSILNTATGSMSDTYTSYSGGKNGAYVNLGNNGVPFLNTTYAQAVSLEGTTGKVIFHVYKQPGYVDANANACYILRPEYSDGTYIDEPVSVNELQDGWTAVEVIVDTTKSLSGVLVYSQNVTTPSTLAAGSVYVKRVKHNFGGVTKANPYNTYADSEAGTRGAYVALQPSLLNMPFVHMYHEKGIDITNTDGYVYVNLYWTGTASEGDKLVVGFSSGSKEGAFSTGTDPEWPVDVNALTQGWNTIPFPVGIQEGLSIDTTKITTFQVYNQTADGTTGLACGAVYVKNNDSTRTYFVNAQDEVTTEMLNNCTEASRNTIFTDYGDNTKGAYICAGPTVNHIIPFLTLQYATPIPLVDTTGNVTFNLYHTANSEASEDSIVVRLIYSDGTNAELLTSVTDLESGWDTVTIHGDTTKLLSGVMVYATAMTGTTALAAGSVYVSTHYTLLTTVQPVITDSIAMTYTTVVNTALYGASVPVMTFTMNGKTTEPVAGSLVSGTHNVYTFTYSDVWAQCMADTITASLTVGATKKNYEYSILDYCVSLLETDTLEGYSAIKLYTAKRMIVDLITYGASVQKYRDNTLNDTSETLLTNLLVSHERYRDWLELATKESEQITPVDRTGSRFTINDSNTSYTWKSASLVLKDKVTIRCKFTADSIANLKVKYQIGEAGETETPIIASETEANVYYVYIDDISAHQYGTTVQVKFYVGDSLAPIGKTLNYSVNSYLATKLNANTDQTLKALLQAINNYGNAAIRYDTAEQPKLINTKYATLDSVVAAADVTCYGADATGVKDSTDAFRAALKDVSNAGGGTVWIPEGRYIISKNLTIPALVTLRGDWNDPDVAGFNGEHGTIILAHTPPSTSEQSGLFQLEECSGVEGITVYYPEQSITNVKAYEPTFFLKRVTRLRTIKNVTLINSYTGVFVGDLNESTVLRNVKGTCLNKGMEVESSADVGVFDDVTFAANYWANAGGGMNTATRDAIVSYCKNNYSKGFLLHDLEQQQFSQITADGYHYGIYFSDEPTRFMASGPMYQVTTTDCYYGIYAAPNTYTSPSGYAASECPTLTSLDWRCGYIVSDSNISGSVHAIYNGCQPVKYTGSNHNYTGNTYTAYIKLAGTTLNGTTLGNVIYSTYGEDLDLSGHNMQDYRTVKSTGTAFEAVASGASEAEIQAALTRVGAAGGGVVYLPAGNYTISAGLSVPGNTEIVGAAASAQRIPNKGTVLWCRQWGSTTEQRNAAAMVTLSGNNSGISGVYFMYDENIYAIVDESTSTTPKYFPFAVRGQGTGVWAIDCCIAGASHGIDFNNCDNHVIESLFSCCIYSHIEVSGNNGMVRNCLANATVIYRTNGVIPADENYAHERYFNPYGKKYSDYITVGNGVGEQLYNNFMYGGKRLVHINGGTNVNGVNLCSDALGSYVIEATKGSGVVTNLIVTSDDVYKRHNTAGGLGIYNVLRNFEPAFSDYYGGY